MSEKIDQIVEELKILTLLETSELVSKIEETFGVDASAKELVESTPKPIQEGISKDAANDAKAQIETAGGKVSLT